MDWVNWNLGGKTIFIASCIAAGSMLGNWLDSGINGLSQGVVLLLGFFVYPMLMVFRNNSIHLAGGIACGAGGALLAMIYILKNNEAAGPYIFIGASIALIVGVFKYQDQQDT